MGSTGSPGFNHTAIIRQPGVWGQSPWQAYDPVPLADQSQYSRDMDME